MSEPRFTKGEWSIRWGETVRIVDENEATIATLSHLTRPHQGPRRPYLEVSANATVMAASKDLYQAAAAALGLLTGNMDGDLPADADPVQMLRAALAKAGAAGGEG